MAKKGFLYSNMQLLRSAKKYGESVRAVVVTGSVNSITTGDDLQTRELNASAWLPVSDSCRFIWTVSV